MPGHLSLLNQQPQEIKDQIATKIKTQHIAQVVDWLNDQGIDVNYNQLRHYIATHNLITRLQEIKPVKGYKAKVCVYIGALLEYNDPNYTINNIRLRGSSWSEVSVAMHRSGLIEPMRRYSPIRWNVLASKNELSTWCEEQCSGDK
jgi:hypothetical protein